MKRCVSKTIKLKLACKEILKIGIDEKLIINLLLILSFIGFPDPSCICSQGADCDNIYQLYNRIAIVIKALYTVSSGIATLAWNLHAIIWFFIKLHS